MRNYTSRQKANRTVRAETGRRVPARSTVAGSGKPALSSNIFRYVLEASGWHQLLLVVLTVAVFLLEVVPLELQRRIVNDLVKHRDYQLVIVLCAVYVGVVLVQGGAKLGLNIYRSWLGERAIRDLRRRIRAIVGTPPAGSAVPEASGIEVSMIVAEVEPIGGFVGASISEPLLQGGVLLSVLAYMIHVEPWMALVALALFVPQLVFVPLIQHAINRRTGARVWLLRQVSVGVIDPGEGDEKRRRADDARIGRIFELNMGIFRLKFTMNFLMNLCNHLEIVGILLVGGWLVYTEQLEIGGVVAFISGIARLNDPWGDLVNYFRDVSSTQVKFRLVADAFNRFVRGQAADM